ncbi:hypothetical protein EUTSA_v10021906mg [Eutrema salsugineum]|uniref:F-box domain-containing protein n=1 Tax=Eutrema salsugineum TaxID=72664 RepID=V4LAW0_EUTSA|nr:putative F-box protein At3g23260 [Eutrema salsugineum]ESQ47540.1 hypothetical protein EUTSA_v10021906mg [Eutrema salsugineum]
MESRSLPMDLAEEILSRVPAKSVARLRSKCKGWNALLKSRSFVEMHTAKAPKEESLVIMLIHSRVYLVRIAFRGNHDKKVAPSAKVASRLYLKDPLSNSSQADIRNVFHCEGLFLCTTEDNRLVVWNPCSRETKWIKPRDSYKEFDYYALGYDNKSSCKQYKILRVDRHQVIPIKNEYEIYDFTSNSWRVVGVATDWFLALSRRGISVKWNTYWVATQAGTPHAEYLLSFDFSTERFQTLPLPHRYTNAVLSAIGEEQLCLLCTSFKYSMETLELDFQVWVANSTGSVWSWSKSSLVVDYYRPIMYSNGMSFLVDEHNEVVMCLRDNDTLHIACKDIYTNTHIVGGNLGGDSTCISSSCSVLLNYVPSLVQIQQGGRRKRKTPSTCDL